VTCGQHRTQGRQPHPARKSAAHYALAVALSCEVFDLQPTRNRERRQRDFPCGAIIVAAAATLRGFDISESRVANLWAVYWGFIEGSPSKRPSPLR